MFKRLLRSRKVVLAAAGVVQTIASYMLGLPPEIWISIDALLIAVIGGIAYEDGAEKRNEAVQAVKAVQKKEEEKE